MTDAMTGNRHQRRAAVAGKTREEVEGLIRLAGWLGHFPWGEIWPQLPRVAPHSPIAWPKQ